MGREEEEKLARRTANDDSRVGSDIVKGEGRVRMERREGGVGVRGRKRTVPELFTLVSSH